VDTKVNIEIKGDAITINGQPLSDYKNDDVSVTRRKQVVVENQHWADLDAMGAPRTMFRVAPGRSYSYNYTYSNGNKAFLGVGTEKTTGGVKVVTVSDNSGAEKAGLKAGDIITKINETKIETPEDLTKAIGKLEPENKVTISYLRNKKAMKATATLGKNKEMSYSFTAPEGQYKSFNVEPRIEYNMDMAPRRARLGIKAQETEEGKGLKVLDVDDESAADKAGIKEGDIITSFNGTEVNSVDKLRTLADDVLQKPSFKLQVLRDGKSQEIEVKLPKNLKSTKL